MELNTGIYRHKTTTELLRLFQVSINKKYQKTKIKSLIKELQTRQLTDRQREIFNRLVVRYMWI